MTLIGKTIARVVDLDLDRNGHALIFTDGTAAHFQGSGYEDSCCSLDPLTEFDVLRMEADIEDQRRTDAVTRERTIARRELKERIQRNVSPQAWVNWCRVHVSPMESAIDAMHDSLRRDMNRQAFSWTTAVGIQAVIPTSKSKARRS